MIQMVEKCFGEAEPVGEKWLHYLYCIDART